MIRTIKKIAVSALSILLLTSLVWVLLLLNPSMLYGASTEVGNVTIFHNAALDENTSNVLKNAATVISTSEIYDKDFRISLCLNDDSIYPHLNPLAGATAYAFKNITCIYDSEPDFNRNVAEFSWKINENQLRKFDLTYLLAHEFMHNLQYHSDPKYYYMTTATGLNWKLEGHAEYVSRGFKNDGNLRSRIQTYQSEIIKDHIGIPVFKLPDGTVQSLGYYQYSIVVQYLMEVKGLNFRQLCELQTPFEEVYAEVSEWGIQ